MRSRLWLPPAVAAFMRGCGGCLAAMGAWRPQMNYLLMNATGSDSKHWCAPPPGSNSAHTCTRCIAGLAVCSEHRHCSLRPAARRHAWDSRSSRVWHLLDAPTLAGYLYSRRRLRRADRRPAASRPRASEREGAVGAASDSGGGCMRARSDRAVAYGLTAASRGAAVAFVDSLWSLHACSCVACTCEKFAICQCGFLACGCDCEGPA